MKFDRTRSTVRKNTIHKVFRISRPHPGIFPVLGTIRRQFRQKTFLGKFFTSINRSASDHQLPGWRGCRTSRVLARNLVE